MKQTNKQRAMKQLRHKGQGLVEYALILTLVALVAMAAVALVGSKVQNAFSNAANGLNS